MATRLTGDCSLDEIFNAVVQIVSETKKLPPQTIKSQSTFEELGVDSLDGLNIFFAVEQCFDVSIPDEEAQKLQTIGEVVRGIQQLLKSAQAST